MSNANLNEISLSMVYCQWSTSGPFFCMVDVRTVSVLWVFHAFPSLKVTQELYIYINIYDIIYIFYY